MYFFVFSSRRRHTICALVTGVQTCALPILSRRLVGAGRRVRLPAGDPGPQRTQEEGVVSEAGRHVLLADIGGTNARFALADTAAQLPLLEDSVKEYAVADFPSLGDAALHYFDEIGRAHV